MRKPVIFLALTTATFAASTIYLLATRPRTDAAPTAPATDTTVPARPAAPTASSAVIEPSPATPANDRPAANATPRLGDLDRRFLADAADPVARLKLIADTKANLAAEYRRLGQIVGLGSEELDRLLSLLAEQRVTGRESYLRCRADTAVDPDSCPVDMGGFDDSIVALLGAERQSRFEKYLKSLDERRLVARVRGALPDDQFMFDQQADELAAALAEENERRQQELGDALQSPERIASEVPLVYTAGATRESLTAEAREHFDRLHARAAKLLRPGQLKVYESVMEQRFGGVEYAIQSYLERRAATSPR